MCWEEHLLKTAYAACVGCQPENCQGEAKVEARKAVPSTRGKKDGNTGHKPQGLSQEGQEQDTVRVWVDRAQTRAVNQPRALGHLTGLPDPHTLQTLRIQCQKGWLKKPRDTQKMKICVPVLVCLSATAGNQWAEPRMTNRRLRGWRSFAPGTKRTRGRSLSQVSLGLAPHGREPWKRQKGQNGISGAI